MALMFKTFESNKHKYVFDGNTNAIFILTDADFMALEDVEENENPAEESLICLGKMQESGIYRDVDIKEVLHPCSSLLQYHLSRRVEKLTLQVTQRCNLRCEYCAYSGLYDNRQHGEGDMTFETARKALDFLLEHSIDTDEVNIGFYGGEPLLQMDLIMECIAYVRDNFIGKTVTYSITTNGTLLTLEVYERLLKEKVMVSVSLDGPEKVHDFHRKYANGKGTYADIMANLSIIKSKHPIESKNITFMTVVNPGEESCAEKYFSFEEISDYNAVTMSFINDVGTTKEIQFSQAFNESYSQEYCKVLLHMLGELDASYVSKLMMSSIGALKSKHKNLEVIYGLPESAHPGGPCIPGQQRLFVDIHGNLYPCERVSERSEIMRIGTLDDGFDIDKAMYILNPAKSTEEQCIKCWAFAHCGMCAHYSDNKTSLSAELRLARCQSRRESMLENIKDICFLKEQGYDFQEGKVRTVEE